MKIKKDKNFNLKQERKDVMTELIRVYDKRDDLTSYICRDCIEKHFKHPILKFDMLIFWDHREFGECVDAVHND